MTPKISLACQKIGWRLRKKLAKILFVVWYLLINGASYFKSHSDLFFIRKLNLPEFVPKKIFLEPGWSRRPILEFQDSDFEFCCRRVLRTSTFWRKTRSTTGLSKLFAMRRFETLEAFCSLCLSAFSSSFFKYTLVRLDWRISTCHRRIFLFFFQAEL